MKTIGKLYDWCVRILFFIAGILLGFAALSVAAGIGLRFFFDYPLPWVTEIAEYILLFIPFLVGVWVLKHDGHVKMDILVNRFPSKSRAVINIITSAICSIDCLVLSVFGAKVTLDLYRTKAFTYTILEIPRCILTGIVFLGFFLLFIGFIQRISTYINEFRTLKAQG